MMHPEEVKALLAPSFPHADITVADMTGTQDHFQIQIISDVFRGKMLIEQHQMVQKPLKEAMDDGRIHAIAIKTFTPESWEKENEGSLKIID